MKSIILFILRKYYKIFPKHEEILLLIIYYLLSSRSRHDFIVQKAHRSRFLLKKLIEPLIEDHPDIKDLSFVAYKYGYLGWARKINTHLKSKSVLEIGVGSGLHAIGYIIHGAKNFTGIEPFCDFDNSIGVNKKTGKSENLELSLNQIMKSSLNIKYIKNDFNLERFKEKFDLVILHNVTEHLMEINESFKKISKLLNDEGSLLFNHHSYYCWDGHHMQPRTVDKISNNDAEQKNYIDWKHLEKKYPKDHYINKGLNKIRLDDLKNLTQKYFKIKEWNEIPSTQNQGLSRLTNSIVYKFSSKYSFRELSTKHVYCVAELKKIKCY